MFSRLLRALFSRKFVVGILLLIQAVFLISLLWRYSTAYRVMELVLTLVSILACLYIVNRRDKTAFKLSWCIFILVVPLVGGVCYLLFRIQSSVSYLGRKYSDDSALRRSCLTQDESVMQQLQNDPTPLSSQIHYLNRCGFPAYPNANTTYFPSGEEAFAVMLEKIRAAERFVFLEFFIIDEGEMWDTLLAVLSERAQNGVDIRILYDDMGCLWTLPEGFHHTLAERNIRCVAFNPFRPFWTTLQNNRDHRKIVVIDGEYAMTGGFNLADEYINRKNRFGHWKDAGILLSGDAVNSLTVMFLSMWANATRQKPDFTSFLTEHPELFEAQNGIVQPYSANPTLEEYICEYVYLQIIHTAKHYLYIQTPYLIIGDAVMSALKLAAKSGVDVRIITPGIPDKKFVFATTRAHYQELIEAGVKIYEYTPGFLHAKIFVCDDETATVGTANLDFRSLYLHFECGVRLYRCPQIKQIRTDCESIMEVSHPVTLEECRNRSLPVRMTQTVARLIAPLL